MSESPVLEALLTPVCVVDRDGIAVFFEDGRPFHWFSDAQSAASHDCPPDLYAVSYGFGDWPESWSARWQVSGPRKDYRMESLYSPR